MRRLGEQFAVAGDAMSLGLLVAGMVLAPAAVGLFIDRAMGSSPWATLLGALAGVLFATFGMTRLVLRRYARLAPPESHEEDRTS